MVENKRFRPAILLLFAVILGISSAYGAPLCTSGSFANYAPATNLSAPISCQFQDLIFTFAFDALIYQPDPSQTPITSPDRLENHVNITFFSPLQGVEGIRIAPTDYPWFAANGNTSDINFTYSVSVATPGLYLQGAQFASDITVNSTPAGGGGILAGETICCPNGTTASPDPLILQINQFDTGVGSQYMPFARRPTGVQINKDILVLTLDQGDFAGVNSFDQLFYMNTPEPGVFLLTAGGLGFLLLRKRKIFGRGMGTLMVLGCLTVAGANASPLCTDTATLGGNSLDKYIAAGSCIINGNLFTFGVGSYNYTPPVAGNGIGTDITPAGVTVSVLTGANAGFQFVGQWADSGSQSSSLTLQFSVSAPSGMAINSATFTTTTTKGGTGTISGSSTVTNGIPPGGYTFPTGGVPIPAVPDVTIATLTAVVNLAANGSTTALSRLRDNAHLSNLVMTVTDANYTPEPLSAALLGGGLILLSLIGRKRFA